MSDTLVNLLALVVSLIACGGIYLLRNKTNFTFSSVIALLVGLLIGVIFKGSTEYVGVLGTIYTKVIAMMVIPLLLVSLIKSIYSMKTLAELKKIGLKSVFWLLFQTVLAATLGMIIAIVSKIGVGSHLSVVAGYQQTEIPPVTQVITDLFSNNLFASMAEGKVIPVVFFAILVGIAVVALASKDEKSMAPFKAFVDACHKIVYSIIGVIIKFLPYSIICIMANTIGTSDYAALTPLVTIIILVFIACFIHVYFTDSLLIALFAKINPIKYFKGILPAQVMAFSSRSSSATFPLYVQSLTKNVGVSENVANFVGSLGTTVGMSGCAGVWPPLLTVYAIHSMGGTVSLPQALIIILLCPVISLGTAGVPGGGIMLATAMFVTLGLPVEIVSIFAGIDAFVDMGRTMTNVTSSMTAATIVSRSEEKIKQPALKEV